MAKLCDIFPEQKESGANSALADIMRNEIIFIAPWIYIEGKFDHISPAECAAIETYKAAPRSRRVTDRTCFYDATKNKIMLPQQGAPRMSWWIRAYMEYAWVNFLDKASKMIWFSLVVKKKNIKAAAKLFHNYASQVKTYGGKEEISLDGILRATLAEATMWTYADPRKVQSRSFLAFVEENCFGFLYKYNIASLGLRV